MTNKCDTCPFRDWGHECYAALIDNARLCQLAVHDPAYLDLVKSKTLESMTLHALVDPVVAPPPPPPPKPSGCGCGENRPRVDRDRPKN
jgi:hypothetical protein